MLATGGILSSIIQSEIVKDNTPLSVNKLGKQYTIVKTDVWIRIQLSASGDKIGSSHSIIVSHA